MTLEQTLSDVEITKLVNSPAYLTPDDVELHELFKLGQKYVLKNFNRDLRKAEEVRLSDAYMKTMQYAINATAENTN